MEISSTFWLLEVTNWWHQHEETQSKYIDLSNEAHNIISIIPHGVGVEATSSLWLDDIGWSQSKTPGKRHREKVVVRRFARVYNGILVGDCAVLETAATDNDLELNIVAEERKLHRMAKVDDFLEMWQGSQNLHAT
jgi:hypothetical protein